MSLLLSLLALTASAEAEPVLPSEEWADEAYPDDDYEYEPEYPNAYPAEKVLEAFATACSGIEIPAVAKASLLAAGWSAIEPAAESRIARINTGGFAAMEAENQADPEGPQAVTKDSGIYRKDVAGRELFAIVSSVAVEGIAAHGCRIYDLEAPAGIATKDLDSWAVRPSTAVPTGLAGATKQIWNPGLKPGHMEMEVSFVPQGTKLPAPLTDLPLGGIVLIASALEFVES